MIHQNAKIFNDPIHGHIELSNMCIKIIDTPQFQRLRDISQLGGVYYVFAGASSRRFEHCIGVSYLAREFAEQLRDRQPELEITDEDVLCVEIAGLCHDLGHGPFSHMYDGKFLPQMGVERFVHEHASIALLDLLIEENGLWPELLKNNLHEPDIHFIKELILGDENEAPAGFKWAGRPNKTFLYDIVANKRNGIDVDKFDYFARDCHVLGVTKSFDCHRLMRFARVFNGSQNKLQSAKFSRIQNGNNNSDGGATTTPTAADATMYVGGTGDEAQICFHVKEAWNLFELFHTRYTLHKRAYQHRVSNVVELMVTEVFKLADPFITLPGRDRKPTRMSECPKDMHAYWRLGEYLMKTIENSMDDNLLPAQALIQRIRKRDLFSFVGETLLPANEYNSKVSKLMHNEIMTMLRRFQELLPSGPTTDVTTAVSENDVFCSVVRMGYGKGGKNPVTELTTFYQPNRNRNSASSASSSENTGGSGSSGVDAAVGEKRSFGSLSTTSDHPLTTGGGDDKWAVGLIPSDSVSRLIPREFEEIYVRIFCRHAYQRKLVDEAFEEWCKRKKAGYITPTAP